jgi:hypothetical protein
MAANRIAIARHLAAGFVLVFLAGCDQNTATAPESAAAGQPIAAVPFDGERALGYLEDICRIGPRVSGTEGMTRQQELCRNHFEKLGGTVEMQRFTARQESQKKPTEMANMIVTWYPDRPRRVILCSHYDTRPIADQERERRDWRLPFLSANDGGSGVAFLMEFAHQMKYLQTPVGVDFVLFDGEEYVWRGREDRYFFGSEHFARTYRDDQPRHKYLAAVLLDMIAGKGARFPSEPNSRFLAGKLVEDIWVIAREQKCDAFQMHVADAAVLDDHLALNRIARIPAIDIVDFDYQHWHKLSDLPDKCSAEPLEQVAKVLTVWLQSLK